MKVKLFFSVLMCSLVIILTGCSASNNNQTVNGDTSKVDEITAGLLLFTSDTCPHCKIVEQYIQENNITSKIFFTQLKVSNETKDIANVETMQKVAKKCGISSSELGVPLFWDGQRCFIGDADITSYFKSKIQL